MKLTILVDRSLVIIALYFICLIHALVQTKGEEILHVQYMSTPKYKNACSGGNLIYKYGKPFLSHHCYTINVCDLCLSEEKKIIKK